ncbi:MAG: helix-turn-helix transcriptional regulator [Paludibacteraceae bacterium]|jgi:y4mF family transcriptional regulator|nr:helix-turn-helix transcriptional regulator [Paludibacteraceae bacterium]MBR6686592.1 helix-turn-helix transcriptional regulator [Paludibacteraceae bacterium]MEE0991162.1 helix-turn-helix transcriptional regulator [Paludibacteraceae bacterium]
MIGEYIKQKRKLFRLTQIELADRTGVGIRFIRELENGKPTVQLNKVNQVLELFGETLYPKKINE